MSLLERHRVDDRFPPSDRAACWAADPGVDEAGPVVLEGWAVTYGDEPNFSGRILVPGAFRDSLKVRPSKAKPLTMGYEHSTLQGTNPIGHWRQAKDDGPDKGVFLSDGRVSDTSLGRDVSVLVRDGAMNGLSVGFITEATKMLRGGEEHTFQTPFGPRHYQVAEEREYVTFVTQGVLLETSVVGGPADDEGRLTSYQAVSRQATKALPGLEQDAAWDDLAYSMALLMGGKGAGHDFRDLPELERVALYERLAEGYARQGKTAPRYSSEPDYKDVRFSHDEREVFTQTFLRKTLAQAAATARGLEGPLSREGCAMAMQLTRALAGSVGPIPRQTQAELREVITQLQPHLEPAPTAAQTLSELREALDLARS